MNKDEAMKMALEALLINCGGNTEGIGKEAITAIKEALAQPERLAELGWQEIDCPICGGGARAFPKPEQEPVAIALNTGTKQGVKWLKNVEHGESLYTTPPQRKPLTGDEIWKFWCSRPEVPEGEDDSMEAEFVAAVRRVLAAHGIKE